MNKRPLVISGHLLDLCTLTDTTTTAACNTSSVASPPTLQLKGPKASKAATMQTEMHGPGNASPDMSLNVLGAHCPKAERGTGIPSKAKCSAALIVLWLQKSKKQLFVVMDRSFRLQLVLDGHWLRSITRLARNSSSDA